MFEHVIFPDEALAALLASVRLLARVKTHVPPQIRLVIELFRALFAFVRLITVVLVLVLLVLTVAGEPFATSATLERLVAVVEGFVVLREIARLHEGLVAVVAFVNPMLLV